MAAPAAIGAVVGLVGSIALLLLLRWIGKRLRRVGPVARLSTTPATSPAGSKATPTGAKPTRRSIPERTRHEVWRRDQGRCLDCHSQENLEFDHIIPVSRGGANTTRNIELRCEACNGRKGARI
jgi:5-methylcytosine-specific restriction endonuclease McrA